MNSLNLTRKYFTKSGTVVVFVIMIVILMWVRGNGQHATGQTSATPTVAGPTNTPLSAVLPTSEFKPGPHFTPLGTAWLVTPESTDEYPYPP